MFTLGKLTSVNYLNPPTVVFLEVFPFILVILHATSIMITLLEELKDPDRNIVGLFAKGSYCPEEKVWKIDVFVA